MDKPFEMKPYMSYGMLWSTFMVIEHHQRMVFQLLIEDYWDHCKHCSDSYWEALILCSIANIDPGQHNSNDVTDTTKNGKDMMKQTGMQFCARVFSHPYFRSHT